MEKQRFITLFMVCLCAIGLLPRAFAQTITNPQPVTLPQSPATTHVVGSGQSLTVKSGKSVTLGPGTHFQAGSTVSVLIDAMGSIPLPPSSPSDDAYMNWSYGKSFNGSGTVIGEQRSYFDQSGELLQEQYRNIAADHVLASQPIRDAAGRAVISTLAAPTNNAAFAYKVDFVLNASAQNYSYRDFDRYLSGSTTVDKSHTPTALGGKSTVGTLGWYYGTNNNWEPLQATTDYPYARQLYSSDGTGRPVKAGSVGDEYRLGKGHEPASYSVPVVNELTHYLQVRNKFFSEAEVGGRPTAIAGKAVMTIAQDENGTQAIGISDADGNALLSAQAGTGLTVSNSVQLVGGGSVDGLPADVGFHYFKLLAPATVTITGGGWQLYNMGDKEQQVSFTSGGTLAKGYYRLQATGTTAVNLSYSNQLGTLSYSFYNQLGQLVASITPEGVKKLLGTGMNNYTSRTAIPFTTLYTYDLQGRLVKVQDYETGTSEYVYRRDGSIRFSQDAVQRADNRYSYTNYDGQGRPVESGEYKPATNGVTFANAGTIIESTAANGGLTNGTQYDVVRTRYDVPDAGHGLSGYVQDDYFLRGAVSMTEKYGSITNNSPAADNLISRTWYSYDGLGQLSWSISQTNGLGYKTSDYVYDELGKVTKTIFQKNTAAETFVHYYEYDIDQRLTAVYTNTVDNPSTRLLHARYYYYLHGPLKRVELGDKLQGMDYTYTVDGKLKAINHADPARDPGSDGSGNGFAADVFGMNVEYHAADYVRSGSQLGSVQSASGGFPSFYNGNINGIGWHNKNPNTGDNTAVMNTFRYDGRYQLQSSSWGVPNYGTGSFTEQVGVNREYDLGYDANGNILALKRTNDAGSTVADYTYNYEPNTNRLSSVTGYASYGYDAIGRMTQQVKGSQTWTVRYDVTGKVKEVLENNVLKFSFAYNEAGQRIRKQDHANGAVTWYVYDGAGQLAAVYDNLDGSTLKLREQPIYAGGRIGQYQRQENGYKYQLTDHLGNVRAVVNRNKLGNGQADVYLYADYYPFGTVVRSNNAAWRYGYQGEYAEKDGETGWNAFELRMYDAAIGRWLSVDPYGQYDSPYMAMGNSPVMLFDMDGGWAGIDPPAKVYSGGYVNELPEAMVSASAMTWLDRIAYRESLGLDPLHFTDGRLDHYARINRDNYRGGQQKLHAARDPALDMITVTTTAMTLGEGALLTRAAYVGVRNIASRWMLRNAAAKTGLKYSDDLVKAAHKLYPNKAGKIELHHITPKYLGGAKNGSLVPLDASYHQVITNEFRKQWGYGRGLPTKAQLDKIMNDVYSKYPLPGQ